VEVVIDGPARDQAVIRLDAEPDGYFSIRTARAKAGDLYRFWLDRGEVLVPDPASRFQPEGPLGPSMIIDPARFPWHDTGWNGVKI
jgi:maltooligosyltrehalose trehalohydrolase